ncbi:hypothetical protein QTP88_018040 [Uroleucon formosanum]
MLLDKKYTRNTQLKRIRTDTWKFLHSVKYYSMPLLTKKNLYKEILIFKIVQTFKLCLMCLMYMLPTMCRILNLKIHRHSLE